MNLSKADQNVLVVNTAKRMNMPEAIVEKDFWVCFILDYLFTTFKYRDFICFKGGTSLSKIYNCIERFSEDIDLALDWSVLVC
ncbi:MAG: nucleotidyl transferase AbiEii/AbiGii toxin family protein [Erysipelotrichaceae bacterium]